MQWERFKKLEFLVEMQEQADTCVVLFHGYGADAQDLASLSRVYKLKDKADWYFPQGFLTVPIGPMMSGRAWFELRVSDFEQVSGGQLVDLPIRPQDEKVIDQISEWLCHLGKMYKRVIFGGFSQGAIISSHCFYRLNFTPAGMLLFSGFLISPSSFPVLPEQLKFPFFQCHGERDQVLSVHGARKLYEKLTSIGLNGKWYSFNGGHEIPMAVIAESQTFLNSVLENQG